MSTSTSPATEASAPGTAIKLWLTAYRVEVQLFVICALVLAMFSGQRFLRQSEAPHFVYQAKAWLEGRSDIDPQVLPNLEDWACVRELNGVKQRCEGQLQPSDRWFSSFPPFPSVVMMPFVAIHGYQLNDTSFGVMVAALCIALFYSLLRRWKEAEGLAGESADHVVLSLLLCFGTVFFYCAIRGEVWFSAEVMGVAFTCLYLRHATGARNPKLAGLFWSMAVLTRTPLLFTGVFIVMEVLAPNRGKRLEQAMATLKKPSGLTRLFDFAAGAAPLGIAAALSNQARFGSFTEFGHRFFFNNRVNHDIDTSGLFALRYLPRNLDAAFAQLPTVADSKLGFSPWGLSLFITLPVLALAVVPGTAPRRALGAVAAMVAVLVFSALNPELPPTPGEFPIGFRSPVLWAAVAAALGVLGWLGWRWATSEGAPRLAGPLMLTLVACALPGLFYQNTGYSQFGFRFSLDYTPYVIGLVAFAGWRWSKPLPIVLGLLSLTANFWGAVAFRGFTEYVRRW